MSSISGLSRLVLPAASAALPGPLNIPHGTEPTSPTNGDIWTTSAGLYVRVNGTTVGPLTAAETPASSVTTLTGLQAAVVGTSLNYARQDHQHAVAGVVDTSTTQTVGGVKTFSEKVTVSSLNEPLELFRFPGASASGALVRFNKSRGATVGTHAVVVSGDILGGVGFLGSDGSAYQASSAVYGSISTVGTISATSMPGDLGFFTSAVNSVTPEVRMIISRELAIYSYLPHEIKPATDVTSLKVIRGTDTSPAASLQLWTTRAGVTLSSVTKDGAFITPASAATEGAGLRLPHGAAPSSPVNGDVWTTSAGGLYVRINGTTVGPLNTNGPASSVTTLTGLQSAVVGTSTLYARQDHQHAVAGVVDTSTTQTVGGAKTFSSLLAASAGLTVTGAKTTVAATAAGYASLNYPSGTAPSTPAAGDTWATSAGFYRSVGVASNTTRIPGTLNFSRCSSDSSAATTGTYVVPTGFPATIPVKSGRTYRVEVVGFYQCAATTYAPRHRLQYPTLTAGSITMDSFSAASTNTQTGSAVTLGASSQTFVSAAAGAANTSYLFRLDGFIIPSADGNLIYDFTPNAAGTMRIMAGTFISVTEVG